MDVKQKKSADKIFLMTFRTNRKNLPTFGKHLEGEC